MALKALHTFLFVYACTCCKNNNESESKDILRIKNSFYFNINQNCEQVSIVKKSGRTALE